LFLEKEAAPTHPMPQRTMTHRVSITQDLDSLHSFLEEESSTDKDGLPQLPISASARAFCEMTAPANKGDIKVRAHYRRRFKKPTLKKPKQSTLQHWLSSSPPPKQLSHKRIPRKKSNPEPTTNIEKEDRRFAISLHIQEMRDVLSASCNTDNSPSFNKFFHRSGF
jgi:hypothetical protein